MLEHQTDAADDYRSMLHEFLPCEKWRPASDDASCRVCYAQSARVALDKRRGRAFGLPIWIGLVEHSNRAAGIIGWFFEKNLPWREICEASGLIRRHLKGICAAPAHDWLWHKAAVLILADAHPKLRQQRTSVETSKPTCIAAVWPPRLPALIDYQSE
jgi:hypothetical protein